jgi:hypothetical protein
MGRKTMVYDSRKREGCSSPGPPLLTSFRATSLGSRQPRGRGAAASSGGAPASCESAFVADDISWIGQTATVPSLRCTLHESELVAGQDCNELLVHMDWSRDWPSCQVIQHPISAPREHISAIEASKRQSTGLDCNLIQIASAVEPLCIQVPTLQSPSRPSRRRRATSVGQLWHKAQVRRLLVVVRKRQQLCLAKLRPHKHEAEWHRAAVAHHMRARHCHQRQARDVDL